MFDVQAPTVLLCITVDLVLTVIILHIANCQLFCLTGNWTQRKSIAFRNDFCSNSKTAQDVRKWRRSNTQQASALYSV